MGSRFRYSGKTEFQTTQLNRARRTVQFERRPSQRYARRQSHVLRDRQRHLPEPQVPQSSVTECEMPLQRQSSNSSSDSSTPSVQPTTSASLPLVDSILKSLAKDPQPLELKNQTTTVTKTPEKETESCKTSLIVENSNSPPQSLPNNQVGGPLLLSTRSPIPPESLKCNILKAKTLETEKNSNLVSITSTDSTTICSLKNQHSDAATIVSVVCKIYFLGISFRMAINLI